MPVGKLELSLGLTTTYKYNMRVCCFQSRQQATLALMVGRHFAKAFVVTPPRAGLLTTPSAVAGFNSAEASIVRVLPSSSRWLSGRGLHALPTGCGNGISPFQGVHSADLLEPLTRARTRRRASPASALMMSSLSGAAEGEDICRAAHILCASEEDADAALQRIKNGDNFGDVANDMSSCPSKEKGGDLGWFKKGQMVAEFEAACFGNDPGTMVKVQTQFGWHLVALLSRAVMPRQMSIEDLAETMELVKSGADSKYQFVDVREEDELNKAKLEGFINLPLSKFEEWGHRLTGDNPILDKDKDTVIMCHHGMRSNQMAQHLSTKVGFTKVWNVEGGIHAYAKQVDPSVGVY